MTIRKTGTRNSDLAVCGELLTHCAMAALLAIVYVFRYRNLLGISHSDEEAETPRSARSGIRIKTKVLENYAGKRIEVFENGADVKRGKKFTVSTRVYLLPYFVISLIFKVTSYQFANDLDKLLDHLGHLLGLLYTPNKLYTVSGKRVTSMDVIKNGHGRLIF